MANVRIAHEGYGQLELNRVVFRRDGHIEAQCFLDTADFSKDVPAENGMLLVVNKAARKVSLPKAATDKVLLNYTTEHMYDERANALKDFKLVPGTFLPRLGYLKVGDLFTTNTISYDDATYSTEDALWTAVKNCATTPIYGCPSTDGTIFVSASATNAVVKAVKATTMPDGQKAIQFEAI